MDSAHDLQQQTKGDPGEQISNDEARDHLTSVSKQTSNFHLPKLKHLRWWLRVTAYILCLLAGQTTAILLGRHYYDEGGNSKWMATLVQSAGYPILIPLLYLPHKPASSLSVISSPSLLRLTLLYFGLGLVLTFDNLMYSYGLLYVPVSTYSLLCATQLAFNAVSSYFINAQKFTVLVLNSLVLLSISACLLAINAKQDDASNNVSRGKYIVGFLCTLGASAMYSLYLSSVQLSFDRVIKRETFDTVLEMQLYPSFVATMGCVIGLFASGEWRTLTQEMVNYKGGRVSYAMTLAWTAITWQVSSVGMLGLVFEVSSLFSNVIGTLGLPLVPVFAVVFFHDEMNGVKVIALLLAIWGFLSYIYQHYLDDIETTKAARRSGNEANATIEIC